MFYLEYLNDKVNWVIECRSENFNDLTISINKLLFNGFTIRVVYREEIK